MALNTAEFDFTPRKDGWMIFRDLTTGGYVIHLSPVYVVGATRLLPLSPCAE